MCWPTSQCLLKVLYSEGSKRVLNDCHQVGHWRRFVHAQYLNCYSYDLLEKFRDHVRTIELFVYLDVPPNKTSCVDCFSAEIKSQLSGAVVVVHNADTYPDINQEGINIQPGSLTEIKVKTIKHIQKTPPYGRCSPDTPKTIELYGAAPYRYSEHACRMSTIQTQINDRCGCNAIEFPYRNSSLPFCLAMGSFVHEGSCDVQKLQADGSKATNSTTIGSLKSQCLAELEVVKNHVTCKSDVTRHFEGDVVPSCTLPCQFFSYETDRSTSTWPTKSWQLGWLGTRAGRMILDRPELAPYREARDLMRQPNGDVRAQTLLSQTNVLEKNLLAIMIIRPNFNLHNVEEKEVLSLTSLLSQTGGLLSIWIGMNIMSVIELFELLVHLFGTCKQPENRKKMNEDSSHQLRAVRSEVEETEDGMHITDNLYNGNEERLSQNSIIRHPKNNSNNSTNRRLKQRRTKCLKGTCQRVRQSSTNLECSERSLP
ncbi:FMRFamide-activated amiloride-sensitive sodium channel [Clonorchis sinensis]|uniref:FMRFamide-activated amiloride-sensitive sodium channel n=2 Tax=Clonorchis sinensis TaxID=79923 RepID=G7Y609_CLOSI|nr:FMRFamide-activated amiloride-sensitive sodium channel [Clonorchis sinensis]GAA48395.1 FMRFamide-activated amiloride-sensitive sodium channel [Clonorchis sinensis]